MAVVWLSGPATPSVLTRHFQPRSSRPISEFEPGRVVFGTWAHGDSPEEAIVLRRDGTTFEVHCHGGTIPSQSILSSLRRDGFRIIDHQEYLTRTYGDPWQAAAVNAATRAMTIWAANQLLVNADGRWTKKINDWILGMEHGSSQELLIEDLCRLADSYSFGARLICGWKVAIGGKPNAGKSSLINRLLGFSRSLVFDQPGTTRDVVRQTTAIGEIPVQLLDTAGLRSTDDRIESLGIGVARKSLASADLTVWISDVSQPWSTEDVQAMQSASLPVLIHNKTDLPACDDDRPPGIRISLLNDPNIDEVLVTIQKRLREQLPLERSIFVVCPWQRDALTQACNYLRRNDRAAAQSTLLHPPCDARPATVD